MLALMQMPLQFRICVRLVSLGQVKVFISGLISYLLFHTIAYYECYESF
jgi:hypothetical protein